MAKIPPIKVEVEIEVTNGRKETMVEFRVPGRAWSPLPAAGPAERLSAQLVIELAQGLGYETRVVERWVTEWVPVE